MQVLILVSILILMGGCDSDTDRYIPMGFESDDTETGDDVGGSDSTGDTGVGTEWGTETGWVVETDEDTETATGNPQDTGVDTEPVLWDTDFSGMWGPVDPNTLGYIQAGEFCGSVGSMCDSIYADQTYDGWHTYLGDDDVWELWLYAESTGKCFDYYGEALCAWPVLEKIRCLDIPSSTLIEGKIQHSCTEG